ncbi:hypothetical protein CYMTET_13562 [Cymbomonas tetramitiformis]|uniref:Uncharacterized protein n=1 Tax=Cymbomonas tetramitiformis TaxID=36881 RepID=A0AAE0GHV4_9CHLO|nr:hypothetical protein CYMTET_13562 [Cymbomonas tetramitiformis]
MNFCAEMGGVQPITGLQTGEECAAYLSNSMDLNYAQFFVDETDLTYCFLSPTCANNNGMLAYSAFTSGVVYKLRANEGVSLRASTPVRTFSKAQYLVGYRLDDSVAPDRLYNPRELSAAASDSGDYERALTVAMAPVCTGGLINPEPYDNRNALNTPGSTRICINAMCGVYGQSSYVGDRKRETQCQARTNALFAMDVAQVECCADTQYIGPMQQCSDTVVAPCLLPDTLASYIDDYTEVAQYLHGDAAHETGVISTVDTDALTVTSSVRVNVQEREDYDNYTNVVLAVETAHDSLASSMQVGGQPLAKDARQNAIIVGRRSSTDVVSVAMRTGLGPYLDIASDGFDVSAITLRGVDSDLRSTLREPTTSNGIGLLESYRNATLVLKDAAGATSATVPIVTNATAADADGHRYADVVTNRASVFVTPRVVGGTSTAYSLDRRYVHVGTEADEERFDVCFSTCATNQPFSLGDRSPLYFTEDEATADGATGVQNYNSTLGAQYYFVSGHAVRTVSDTLSPAAEMGPDSLDLAPVYAELRSARFAGTKRERVAVRTLDGGHLRRQGVACVSLPLHLQAETELSLAVQEAVVGPGNLMNGGCVSKSGATARTSLPEMTLPYLDGPLSATSSIIASSAYPSLVLTTQSERRKLSAISTHVMSLWGGRGGEDHSTDSWLPNTLADAAVAAATEAQLIEALTDICDDVRFSRTLELSEDARKPCEGFTFVTSLNTDKLLSNGYGGFCFGKHPSLYYNTDDCAAAHSNECESVTVQDVPVIHDDGTYRGTNAEQTMHRPIAHAELWPSTASAASACGTYRDNLLVFQELGLYLSPDPSTYEARRHRRSLLSSADLVVSVGAAQVGGVAVLQVTGADPVVGCPAQCGAPLRYGASPETRTVYYFDADASTGAVTYKVDETAAEGFDTTGGHWPYVLVPPNGTYEIEGDLAAAGQVVLGTTPVGSEGYAVLTINGRPAYQFVSDTGSSTAIGATMPGGWGAFRSDGTPIGDGMTASPTATPAAPPDAPPSPPPLAPGETAFPKTDGTALITSGYPTAASMVNDASAQLRELLPTDGRRVMYATDEVVSAINTFTARRIQNISEQTHVTNVLNGAFSCGPVTATLTTSDTVVSPTSVFNMDVSVPRTIDIDGSDVLSSRVDIVLAQTSTRAAEVRNVGYTATPADKYAFLGQCRGDSDSVDFYVDSADNFYYNRFACGAATGTVDWQLNPSDNPKPVTALPDSAQCENGSREFRLTTTLAKFMGTSETNGHHAHVLREKRPGGVYAYSWSAYVYETVVDTEGLSYTRESQFDFEITLKGLSVTSVSSVGTQLPSAVSDIVQISARGVPATLATHVEFGQEICVPEPRDTEPAMRYKVVNPISEMDTNRATQSVMHPDRDAWGYPARSLLSDTVTPAPGYHSKVKYVTQDMLDNPVSHLSQSDSHFDYAPEVSCRIAHFASSTSYAFNDTTGQRRVSTISGVNLANTRFSWNCYQGYYVCIVPVLTSDSLHLLIQTDYLVESGGLYKSAIGSPAHVKHAQAVLVTGIAQNATTSFEVSMQLRKLQISEDDESLASARRRNLLAIRGVGTSTWSELIRNLYTEPFVDRAEYFYNAGALRRIEVGRPFALNVFLNDAQSRSRYFLRPVSMLAMLRKREGDGQQLDYATSGELRNAGGPLTAVTKNLCGGITSAGNGGDLLNTSKLMRIYGPLFVGTPAARSRETSSFYSPLLAPIDDNLQSSIFHRNLLQYLSTEELYASDDLMSKFVWSNDYRGGLHFASGSNTWFLRNGLDFSIVDPDVRYDLVFCYHGQAIPKAEAGDLDNSPSAVAYRNAAGTPPASTATSRRLLGVPVTAGFVQPGPGITGRALLQAVTDAAKSQNVAPNAMAGTAELMVSERVAAPLTTDRSSHSSHHPPPSLPPPPSPPSPPPFPPAPISAPVVAASP